MSYSYEVFCCGVVRLHGSECWVRRVLERRDVPAGLLGCDGPIDGHHLIAKQRIKRELRDVETLNDARNGVPVCRRHHDLLERRLVVLRRSELPQGVESFAAAFGLGWSLDRDYGVAA